MEVWGGFLIGFLGSIHCIGMCGPIALALPAVDRNHFKVILSRVLYNLGRVITYSAIGALFGMFGNRIVIFGMQQYLSIALGVIILVSVLAPQGLKLKAASIPPFNLLNDFVKKSFARVSKIRSNSGFLLLGILNGLLPCGFVYVGVAGAMTTGSVVNGAIFMMFFGLGTLPLMLGTSLVGQFLNINIRKKLSRLIPVFAVILALIFILRGLNLGIPYLSPKLVKAELNQEVICH
jgi:sulfite exporter TauE/SafE